MFKNLEQQIKHGGYTDLSVIFFTDGCDTCNSKAVLTSNLDKLKKAASTIRSRFLTIGFTSSHDALFLNEIAKAGTELGNFYYIDVSQPGYPDKI